MARHEESKETPEIEARAHTPGFLQRAAKMAKRKKGRGRKRGIKTGRY